MNWMVIKNNSVSNIPSINKQIMRTPLLSLLPHLSECGTFVQQNGIKIESSCVSSIYCP